MGKYILIFSAVAGLSGCPGALIQQAPTFLPSLERCQRVDYHREGAQASLTLRECTLPVGEMVR